MEGGIPHAPRPVRTVSNVLWPHKLPSYLPSNDERNLSNGGGSGMVISVHGRHRHPHKTARQRNRGTTRTMAQTVNLPSTQEVGNARPIPQTRKVQIPETRNRIPRCHHRKRSPQDEPKETGKRQKLDGTQKPNRNTKISGVYRILPILRPELLTNHMTIITLDKENNPLGMD